MAYAKPQQRKKVPPPHVTRYPDPGSADSLASATMKAAIGRCVVNVEAREEHFAFRR